MTQQGKIDPETALAYALEALAAAPANERLVDVTFGTFAESTRTPGGALYSLTFRRVVGNTADDDNTYSSFREQDRSRIIRDWRREFYPTPEERAAAGAGVDE